ncbi:MAG: 4-alpha-glucanotransferase [Chloroflexi bacterium]|nr:4-alpha-glucanotransferase [Chloroflexota bacterium]
MKFERSGGVILHPSSLPGPDGIGDLGPEAYRWINFLARSGFTLWQILPLGPTGYGDSPYQCFSAFAGNPYLISPTVLLDEELLTEEDLSKRPEFPPDRVDYGPVIEWKISLLDRAFKRFKRAKASPLHDEFNRFQKENESWLADFSLFMAIKELHGGVSWDSWPEPLRQRDPDTLQKFKIENEENLQRHSYRQFLFFRQWDRVHKFALERGIQIVGDVPIFVAYDSAEVWAHPELFYLDSSGLPTFVAGVPPDYFSPTGQLWGNPLYRWEVHAKSGYAWWIERLQASLRSIDAIRLDHFRGFAGYWEVPAGMPTAEIGRWAPGPAADFFRTVQKAFLSLPIIAEDLGEITPDVVTLREEFSLPGMKILQFGFSTDPDDPFLPHNYPERCVAYTGTHDNDTSVGWYNHSSTESERDFCRRYLARSGEDIAWDLIRGVWSSVACWAVTTMQDVLGLGTEARMNFPGKPSGNWSWRMPADALSDTLQRRLYEMNYLYSRLPEMPVGRSQS